MFLPPLVGRAAPFALLANRHKIEVVMYTRRWLFTGILLTGLTWAQEAPPSIQVTGVVKQALTLTADDLAKMPRGSVKTMNNGMETVYDGVWLHEILKKSGCSAGK